jgi:hypothetical protein
LPVTIDSLTEADITAITEFITKYGETYHNEFVVKSPYVTASTPKYGVGMEGILRGIRLYARDPPLGHQGYIPYVIIQPRIRSPCQVKIACFAGKARFRCGKRKYRLNSFKGYSEKDLFDFAEKAINVLRENCPNFFWQQLIRVDLLLDTALNRLVVVEFEGFEADTEPMDSKDDAVIELNQDITKFWLKHLFHLIAFHIERKFIKLLPSEVNT